MHTIIVGSGPVGMTLACRLAQQGLPFTLLDKREDNSSLPRGIAINQSTLEIFRAIGVYEALSSKAVRVARLNIYRNHGRPHLVSFDRLDIRDACFFHLAQTDVEEALRRRLAALGHDIQRGVELVALESRRDGVTVQCMQGGRARELHGAVVAGCDGGHSAVRRLAGIELDERAYGGYFALADIKSDYLPYARRETHYFLTPKGYVMLIPIAGDRHRLIMSFHDAYAGAAFQVDRALLEETFAARLSAKLKIDRLDWTTHSAFGHRLARQATKGRIALAGDALHQFSPIGGTNMNVGISDAASLAAAVAARDLGAYAEHRQHDIASNAELTRYLTRLMVRRTHIQTAKRPFTSRSLSALFERELPLLFTGQRPHALA